MLLKAHFFHLYVYIQLISIQIKDTIKVIGPAISLSIKVFWQFHDIKVSCHDNSAKVFCNGNKKIPTCSIYLMVEEHGITHKQNQKDLLLCVVIFAAMLYMAKKDCKWVILEWDALNKSPIFWQTCYKQHCVIHQNVAASNGQKTLWAGQWGCWFTSFSVQNPFFFFHLSDFLHPLSSSSQLLSASFQQ